MATSTAAQSQLKTGIKHSELKWGKAAMNAGWSLLPNTLLEHQQKLDLDAVDINIILHLVRHWWYAERLPHPSKRRIANAMNISQSTVQRHIRRLESRGLIKRLVRSNNSNGRVSNEYDLRGLRREIAQLAKTDLAERKRNKEYHDAGGTRSRPLRVHAPGKV